MSKICRCCKKETEACKRGWNNQYFCCESCEREIISELLSSMPGAGPLKHGITGHINTEIFNRWKDEF